ncbi:glutamate-rich protein 6B [Ochotona curzoniae]|uniref:glutamate-rich protein 6B n=1 Tax=Ochotona curzoniae TaxID=130825 RepID=UPI001B34592F|nr:glutamate-rich protein 6B [Ochotona curzoniae]
MSAKNSHSSIASPASPPTTSQHSTPILSSEEEDFEAKVDDRDLQAISPSPEGKEQEESVSEREYLQEDEYLYDEKYLASKDYLYGKYLKEELKTMFPLQSKSSPIARSSATGITMVTTHSPFQLTYAAPPPTSEAFNEYYTYTYPFSSMRDQESQTEWTYESKPATSLIAKSKAEKETTMLTSLESETEVYGGSELDKEYENGQEPSFDKNVEDSLLEEVSDKQEAEEFDVNFLNSSYQSVFRLIIQEMAALRELEEDFDIPLTKLLESQNKKKLRMLLKKNFDKYKAAILWILKRREGQKASEMSTLTYSLSNPPKIEEPKGETTTKSAVHVRLKKPEIDTEWIKQTLQAHQGDGRIILYPNKKVFQILFPDGTGQIHYPSGNLALLISCTQGSKFTYIILEDSTDMWLRALVNNSGHATFYDDNREVWLSLSNSLGYYFPKDEHTKAWNWWNLGIHVHTPPVQSITLKINQYIKVQIQRQDNIIFTFVHEQKRICFNLGTRYKLTSPELLCEMGKTAILEVEPGPTAQKIQTLLKKMNRILNSLSVRDLKKFKKVAKKLLEDHSKMKVWSFLDL